MIPNRSINRLIKKIAIIIVLLIFANPFSNTSSLFHDVPEKFCFQIINPFFLKIVDVVVGTLYGLEAHLIHAGFMHNLCSKMHGLHNGKSLVPLRNRKGGQFLST